MIKKIIKNVSNIYGWSTNRKIIVIESDDWGSIRMSSNESYNALIKAGVVLSKGAGGRYNKYDTLASKEDLSSLFEVLSSVKDSNNNAGKLSAMSLLTNPNFEKIKQDNFQKYHYELYTQTLERYGRADAISLWKQGINEKIFVPEFHGREHLNVATWMRALQSNDKDVHLAFEHGVTGYHRKNSKINFQAAFDVEFPSDIDLQKEIVKDGLSLFEQIHGFKSRFFVPPNGRINDALEETAANNGIQYVSTSKIHFEALGDGKVNKQYRHIGKKNKHNQTYITRNAFFEPSGSVRDEVNGCLSEIACAFRWKKPAIISSHRINYIGSLDSKNRDNSLKQLEKLLSAIIKKWPDAEFMTSSELGDLVTGRIK
uniref:polysaccharide (de)acetylase n=1 Tax=Flavobacterium sp. TaxID=239 RepID=UPI00404A28E4